MSIPLAENFYKETVSTAWTTGAGNFYVSNKPTITEGYMVISPNNSTLREIVKFTATGTDGGGDYVTILADDRGLGGTTDQTHEVGEFACMNVVAENLKDISDAIDQAVFAGAQYADENQIGVVRFNSSPNTSLGAVTVTIASPAVFSFTSHGLVAGDTIELTTTGSLPTGLVASTTYYVISTGLTSNAFQVSATLNGSAVNTSGSQSGTHTLVRTSPVAIGPNDPNIPTTDEKAAMAGNSGTPSNSNTFVTEEGLGFAVVSFGDGSDGNVTISSPTTLTRNMYYDNLTVNNTLTTDGYKIYVKGTLSGTGTINWGTPNNGSNGTNGVSNTSGGGGAGGTSSGSGPLKTVAGAAGGGGATSGTATAGGSSAPSAVSPSIGSDGANGGTGGAGDGTSGGTGTGATATAPSIKFGVSHFGLNELHDLVDGTLTLIKSSATSAGGGGGGADNDATAGAGGGGGAGASGGIIWIVAKTVSGTFTISNTGGNGGNGGNAGGGTGLAGGGGGGAGGPGGVNILLYGTSTWSGSHTLTGGSGGSGGTGYGGGGAGTNGSSTTGISYEIQVKDLTQIMATPTEEQRKKFLKQLQDVQERLNEIKKSRSFSGDGQVAGASDTSGLNPAQIGGSSGVGFETEENQQTISEQVQATTESGGSKSQAGDRLSSQQAANLVSGYGLSGMVNPSAFAGLTYGEAAALARAEQQKRTSQISSNTTFTFNPETLKRTQRAIDKLGFALDEADNDPFEPNEFKDENKKASIELTEKEIGKLFNDPNELLNAYQTNPQFQQTIDSFLQAGGTMEGISKNITAPVAGQDIQDPASYLANLSNPQANQEAEDIALEELAPESQIAQDEIARLSNIPDDLKSLYFGNEKSIGLLEMKRVQAEEEIRILEEEERDAQKTARDEAALQIDKNKAEVKKQRAQIEENRLRAKNYMTAQLAKLGALKTTGAAPLALETLEVKYQGQITNLETAYDFASRAIEVDLEEKLDGIENDTDRAILSIQEDLTKDTETVTKEILKAQRASEKEIYRITEQYARRLRTRTTKYTEDLKKATEKYAKEFAKTAGDTIGPGNIVGGREYREGQYVLNKGVLLPNGQYDDIGLTPSLEREVVNSNIFGGDAIRYFVALPKSFRDLVGREAASYGEAFDMGDLQEMFALWEEEQDDEDGPLFEE